LAGFYAIRPLPYAEAGYGYPQAGQAATYSLRHGAPLEIVHHGEQSTLAAREPVTRPTAPVLAPETQRQPPGREPTRRLSAMRLGGIDRKVAS
jgi:hypothetical protein